MDTQMNNQMNVAPEKEEQAVELYSKQLVEFGKSNVFYLAYVISLSLVGLGFLLAFVFSAAVGGSGVAISTMVTSTWGYILRALVYVPILVALGFGLFSAWRLYLKKNDNLLHDTKALSLFPSVMVLFSVFALIDSIFIAFISIVKSGYAIVDTILNFLGYESFDLFLSMVDPDAESAGALEVIVSVLFGLVFVAFALGLIFVYLKIKNYHASLSNFALRGNYEIESKPPYIFLFVFAGIYIAVSVIAFMTGNWVTAIIDIALALYFTSSALLFRATHAYLSVK